MCTIDGRKVVVTGGDFTVRGGSGGGPEGGLGVELRASERAKEWLLPYVRLLDAAGGSVRSFEDLGRTYLPDGNSFTAVETELIDLVPVVSAVMGSVAGLPAVQVCIAHWNVMVRETGHVFPGGPPVVKAALGYDITKEELGGAQVHAQRQRRRRQPRRRRRGRARRRSAASCRTCRPTCTSCRHAVSPRPPAGDADRAARGDPAQPRGSRSTPGRSSTPSSTTARSSRSRRTTASRGSPAWRGSTASRSGS